MKKLKPLIYSIVVLIIIILVAYVSYWVTNKKNNESNSANDSVGQAVFLDNGQVYFGNVSHANDKTVILKDIYYLQVDQSLQDAGSGDQNTNTKNSNSSSSDKSTTQPNISLVKLGEELHGPKDEMKINHEHILFIEDMKSDSKVNQAIKNYTKNGSANSAPVSNGSNDTNQNNK